jgi:hypothetical protein
MQRDYIIVRAGKNDDDTITDLAFTYNSETKLIDVVKFISKEYIESTDEFGNKSVGSVRNYWSDYNRNNGAYDKNFSWESYNANSLANSGDFSFEPKSSIMLRSPNKTTKNYNEFWVEADKQDKVPECIAYTILDYVKYNKDVTLLPLQDIGRYFDSVFKVTITSEGYELKDSAPVNRVGKADDENDGYIPFKYHIDGDNDDSLVLMMRLSRSSNNKVQLEYRGASQNNRVREQKQLRWNIFNQDIMEKVCNDILYVFASKLNLNHTRKIDRLMNYVSRNKNLILTNAYKSIATAKNINIHEKGNRKSYRLWSQNHKNSILVNVEVKDKQASFSFQTKVNGQITQTESRIIKTDISIFEMYSEFQMIYNSFNLGL